LADEVVRAFVKTEEVKVGAEEEDVPLLALIEVAVTLTTAFVIILPFEKVTLVTFIEL
jgi:hypothetical protein